MTAGTETREQAMENTLGAMRACLVKRLPDIPATGPCIDMELKVIDLVREELHHVAQGFTGP